MNDLLALAIRGHGGLRRWQQLSRFRAVASISGAISALKGRPGLLEDIALEGVTRDQRMIVSPFPGARLVNHVGAVPADDRNRGRDPDRRAARPPRHSPG